AGETGRQQGQEEWGGKVGEIAGMVVIQCIYALVCLLGLLGNSLVIFVILRYTKMKTATNIYLLNLAIADELFMLSIPFVATSAALHHWQRRRSEGKLTRLVLMVVAMFVVCWMPFYVVQLVNLLLPGRLDATVNNASLILSYSNSCANPILYGFLSENFRHSFHGVLRRCLDASLCCCHTGEGAAEEEEEEEEEPLDYCTAPRGDDKGCMCPTLPCQQEPVHPEPCCKPGPLLMKTTTF
ncbi:PREDICTED: somatostatin receptor type 4-like, partial [Apaloderma vittatum]|uniref:somatostatin receptor type 4-like n=1 Tax=Apaloderma vittatum TaxID=57397 RepID=UPI0005212EB9